MNLAKFEFSLFGINTYVVFDPETKDCAIIDPGMINTEEENALKNFIERNSLKVTDIINTHLHIDHAIGDAYVQEKYGVPLEAHEADAMLGKRIEQQAVMFGVNEKARAVEITSFLEEGEKIRIGEGELEVLHVPGHSPGSVVLYDKTGGFLIAGDVLFQGSIGRTDLPGGDYGVLLEGIRNKLLVLPPETVVLPGHGNPTTIGEEIRSNPFLR